MTSFEAPFLKEAIKGEMDLLISNKTWFLTNLREGCKIIGYKWNFRKKLKTDGSIEKFKVRLVAKGFKQEEGVDFFDTYTLDSKIIRIRILVSLASFYKLETHQMDVKMIFLNGDLEDI